MKKNFLLIIVTIITLILVIQGSKNYNYIMATGGTAGTYYPFGGAIAQILNSNISGMNMTAQATGASKENLRLIEKGDAEFALVQNDVMDYALKGIEIFKDEKLKNFATIATLYPEVIQIVVNPNSKINTVADMKGKKISVGAAGSGVEANAKQVLEAYGLTFDDIKASRLSFNESADAYKNKQIDGFFVVAGVPNTAIQDLTTLGTVKILSIDKNRLNSLIKKYPFYTSYTITKDTYKDMDKDAITLSMKATLICKKDLEEDIIYTITKTLFEKQPDLEKAHAKGASLKIEDAVKGIPGEIHPGALKYYKEKKIVK